MSLFPEGTTALPTDDEARSLKKWNELLVSQYGAVGTVPFPEGTTPKSGDDERRSKIKIDAILATL